MDVPVPICLGIARRMHVRLGGKKVPITTTIVVLSRKRLFFPIEKSIFRLTKKKISIPTKSFS